MISIGIPTLNRYDKLKECLESIQKNSLISKVIVVDNGRKIPNYNPQPEIYSPNENLGVAKSWNWLLQNIKEPLIICNDDIKFGENDIQSFYNTYQTSDAGLLYTDNLSYLNMFSCFMIRPITLSKIGYFDETFYPAYFEDCDYFRRMVLANITWQSVPTFMEHTPSSTLKQYTTVQMKKHHEDFKKNSKYYISKWGGLPRHEMFATPFNQ